MTDLMGLLTQRLSVFAPTQCLVQNDSAAHEGHTGHTAGAAHFSVTIASTQFDGLPTIACHRLIYEHLKDLIPYPIHALQITIIR